MKSNSDFLHIAVIMDGNGRWAKKRLLPRKFGHKEGVKTLLSLAEHAFNNGVSHLTVYAFSTENKYRPKEEIDALIDLIRKNFATTFKKLVQNGISVRIFGDKSYFPTDVQEIMNELEVGSKNGQKGILNVALNYGGRDEIVTAAKKIEESGKEFTEEEFSNALYSAGQPNPDILIRTGGEKRLSNFLLYQCAYTELFFTDTLWPDFTTDEFDSIISQFHKRNRRYGKV